LDNDSLTPEQKEELEKEKRIKQLAMVVCICKGIPLHRVLKGLEGSETVEEVNRKTGCGSGGCNGQRCGPRIRLLLKKKRERDEQKVSEEPKPE
jgi:NAD(P)H-nitrite reductase large subunit